MRYLTIVRHAKAATAPPGATDFDRALNERGRSQCEQLRAWASDELALGRYGPAAALVSAAARTRETFQLAFEGTPFVERCAFSDRIYNGLRDVSGEDLLGHLAAFDPVTTSLLVVGHNPVVWELAHLLIRELPDSLAHERYPLAGAYVLALPEGRPVGSERYECVDCYVPR